MGQRSRKRRAAARPEGVPKGREGSAPKRRDGAAPEGREGSAPKGRDGAAPKAPSGSAPAAGRTARGYARNRERDEAARAALQPLGPGERPLAVTIAAAACFLIAIANFVLYLAGWDVQGKQPKLLGVLAFCVVLLSAGVGMWRMRYWAVLGFEVLLGVAIVFAALSLLVASNLQGALLALAVIAFAVPLFWKLIRTMARLQMPAR